LRNQLNGEADLKKPNFCREREGERERERERAGGGRERERNITALDTRGSIRDAVGSVMSFIMSHHLKDRDRERERKRSGCFYK